MSDVEDSPPIVLPGWARWVLQGVAIALGLVILAPTALSAQDLYDWGAAARGLNLDYQWPLLVPIALDLAAAACIGMTIVSSWRRERPGIFGLLVWVFAGVSAYAQFRHGIAERDAGRAQDAWWAMPAFALLGPLLLEVTLHRLRTWLRKDHQEILSGAAGFGARWLVAPWSTLAAWAASRREGIASAPAALQFVADRKTLRRLGPVDAVHYAIAATRSTDQHTVQVWLARRGAPVKHAALTAALAAHTPPAASPAVTARPVVAALAEPARSAVVDAVGKDEGRRTTRSKRQPSAAEQVSKALARTPAATDVEIAARLGLSEATVQRHRRQAVDSVSTPPRPNPAKSTTAPANRSQAQPTDQAVTDVDGSGRQAVDSVSTGDHHPAPDTAPVGDGRLMPV